MPKVFSFASVAANPIELWDITNLSLLEIIDWIGQAQLAVLMQRELFTELRRKGVRTSIDFCRIGSDERSKRLLERFTGYTEEHIAALIDRVKDDPNFVRLQSLRDHIMEADLNVIHLPTRQPIHQAA